MVKDKFNEYDVVFPDYSNSILNTITSILRHYGVSNGHASLDCLDKILDKKYKNVLLVLLDGMGEYNLRELSSDGYFKKNEICSLTSVYPSTTTAAITTYYSGKPPYETGWIAWSQYFKEYGRCMNVLTHTESYTGKKISSWNNDIYENVINYKTVFEMIEEKGIKAYEIMPSHVERKSKRTIIADNLGELSEALLDLCNNEEKKFVMTYLDNPDGLLHKYGATSLEAQDFIKEAEKVLENLANQLSDTLIIVSADHGHKDIENVYSILDYPDLRECLIMPEFFESRFVGFWVKEERKKEFEQIFSDNFKDFVLLSREELFECKLLGDGVKHKKIDDFVGNYVAVSVGSSIFRLQNDYFEGKKVKKSTHCGLSKEEMEVPLIVLECK